MTAVNNRRRYKKIPKEEFEGLLSAVAPFYEFPERFYHFDWEEVDGEWKKIDTTINERCYFIDLSDSARLKIYSSVEKEDGMGREVGADAIRVVVANTTNAKPIRPAFKKVYRDGNWKEHFRIRVSDALQSLGVNTTCTCGNLQYLKRNTKTNTKFLGCSTYPDCTQTKDFKL